MELGIPELAIILVIVLLLWGPGRLGKIGGELGTGIRAFREGLSSKQEDDQAPDTAEQADAANKEDPSA